MHKALAGLAQARIARSIVVSTLTATILVPLMASTLSAQPQRSVGTVRGTVYDSLTRKPLADAVVEVQETARLAYTDKEGRFTLDSVPTGVQRLSFSSPTLDSLGLYGFAREVDVTNDTRRVLLATPSFSTVYSRICTTAESPSRDSAIVFGTVYDATSRTPLSKAQVSLRWLQSSGGGKELSNPGRTTSTGVDGVYGICGVPVDVALTTTARHDSIASGSFTTVVGPARMLRRDLYLSRELGQTADLRTNATPSTGSGIVRGTVRDERGKALAGALVSLTTGNRTTETDAEGRYRLVSVPLGTQELNVQQIGRGGVNRIIDVTSHEDGVHDIVLRTTTVLATMNVRGKVGADQAGFLRRKQEGIARVVEREEILKRNDIGSALKRVPGLRVTQQLGTTLVEGTRPMCIGAVPMVIDGNPMPSPRNSTTFSAPSGSGGAIPRTGTVPGAPSSSQNSVVSAANNARLDQLMINDVVAIEFHPGPASVPMEYWVGPPPQCGLILIWTVASNWHK
jgi:hypothetical protein